MSECMECGAWMDPFEAQQWENCRDCRRQHGAQKVRNLARKGTEQQGRKSRNLKMLGGQAEQNQAGDD